MPVSVEDCVRSHRAWIRLQAAACGGSTGRAGAIDWAFVPPSGTLHLLFPVTPKPDDVSAAVGAADGIGAEQTALWSAVDRKRPWLRELGLRRAWQPWWMGAAVADIRAASSRHVSLVETVREHDAGLAPLMGRPDVLLAEATVDGEWAGRAWMHLDGDVAGLYDMVVAEHRRRRGLGRAILGALVTEAGQRGADRVTMNATPAGAALYAACGFARLGEGRTWWRQGPAPDRPMA